MCWNFCVSTNFFVSFVVVFGVFRDNDVIDLILLAFIGGAGFGCNAWEVFVPSPGSN